jgi:zinc transport system substrate-binding protein
LPEPDGPRTASDSPASSANASVDSVKPEFRRNTSSVAASTGAAGALDERLAEELVEFGSVMARGVKRTAYRACRYAAAMLISSRMPKWIRVTLFVVSGLLMVVGVISALPGCDARPAEEVQAARGKPRVVASHPFLVEVVARLAGDSVEIVAPWNGGGDPAFWKPTADEISAIQSCDLIVLNGAGFEHWTDQAALPRARVCDTTASLKAKFIEVAGPTHSHGPQGEHSHAGTAFTTWVSPELARVQAHEVAARLEKLVPARAAPLAEIDAELAATSAALADAAKHEHRWLASHPVYGYLAQAAGIEIASVLWEPGEMPSDDEWTKFATLLAGVRAAQSTPTAWMLWEADPGSAVRAKLDAMGVKVVVVPQYGDGGVAGGSVIGGIRASAEAMRDAVAQPKP